ncbi:MAG: ABC transporter substrate-binding protein [Candidatus Methanoperedens sp.]|nr:ABC transporter substrate-binding protein [Candidatus Methanoperedens sp.]
MKKKFSLIVSILFVSIIIAGCLDKVEKEPAKPHNANGITDTEIIIGSSLPLTGDSGVIGTQYTHGSLALINETNAQGGIHGRKIRLIQYDDQYDPVKTVANTQKLILEDKVFILFDYVGTPTSIKITDMAEEAKIPVMGIFSGAEELRTPFQPYVFNVRASYYQETDAAIDYFVKNLGLKRIAVFYQDDAFGLAGLRGVEIALNKYGLKPVATSTYISGTEDLENARRIIKQENPDVIVMLGTYQPLATFIKNYKEQGGDPYFYSVSFVGADAFALELSGKGINTSDRIIVTQVVPDPYEAAAIYLRTVQNYRRQLAKHFPQDEPNYVGLEGYMNSLILTKVLNDTGRDLDRNSFIRTAESLKDYSAGIGFPGNYGPNDHQAFDKVFLSHLDNGRFLLFELD